MDTRNLSRSHGERLALVGSRRIYGGLGIGSKKFRGGHAYFRLRGAAWILGRRSRLQTVNRTS